MMTGTKTATKRLTSIVFSSVFALASTTTSSRPSIASAFTTAVNFRATTSTATARRMTSAIAEESTSTTSNNNDPHKFLEDVLGDKSLEWVKIQNENCIAKYGDPTTADNSDYQRILDILDSKDKIPVRNALYIPDGVIFIYSFLLVFLLEWGGVPMMRDVCVCVCVCACVESASFYALPSSEVCRPFTNYLTFGFLLLLLLLLLLLALMKKTKRHSYNSL
jgi:hypothetical protein